MNERELRMGFEDDGMSESEIERALDQHEASIDDDTVEAAALRDAIEEAVPTPRARMGSMSSLLAVAALGMVGVPGRDLGRARGLGHIVRTPTKYATGVKRGTPGSKLARKAAQGKL